ncbi:MAG: CarD family transcriptional regulator [Bacillota bacterium]|nr:CarD family transcriptional regulator [Bacillota bacterium]
MYKIGDKIVYPMHGAGTIEKIETREILGEEKEYYILNISCGGMGLMLPVDNCDKIGVRPVISADELSAVFCRLSDESTAMAENWNKRQRENMEKLKTGDILTVCEIVRNLTRMDRERKLSAGEKKMLTNARRILVSEVMLVNSISEVEALTLIEKAI